MVKNLKAMKEINYPRKRLITPVYKHLMKLKIKKKKKLLKMVKKPE